MEFLNREGDMDGGGGVRVVGEGREGSCSPVSGFRPFVRKDIICHVAIFFTCLLVFANLDFRVPIVCSLSQSPRRF